MIAIKTVHMVIEEKAKLPAFGGKLGPMQHHEPHASKPDDAMQRFEELLHETHLKALDAFLDQCPRQAPWEAMLRLFKQRLPQSSHVKHPHYVLRKRLEQEAQRCRQLRMHQWQHDTHRQRVRLCLEVLPPATQLNPSALLHALVDLLESHDIPLALSLEKRSRPLVTLGPTLPLGVVGRSEWAECVLMRESVPLQDWPTSLTSESALGLRIVSAQALPNHASTLSELAQKARWRWQASPDMPLAELQSRVQAFWESTTFTLEKAGKSKGQKIIKQLNIRDQVLEMTWQGSCLEFTTQLSPAQSLNPIKLLGALFEFEPAHIQNLERLCVTLGEDRRLLQGHRFETKLHNIWEDAVLLGSNEGVDEGEADGTGDEDGFLRINR